MPAPEAIIKDGKVVNADQLKQYWAGRYHQDCIARREMFSILRDGQPDPGLREPSEHDLEELHERILALEERPQLIEKLGDAPPKPKQRPEPGLHGGVTL